MSENASEKAVLYQRVNNPSQFSSDSYHTDYDSGDSRSSLELFRESPAKYAAIRVFRTMYPDPPTASVKIGLALHQLVFEYDKQSRFALLKKRRKPDPWALWDEPINDVAKEMEMTEKDLLLTWEMLKAIGAEPDAWNLLVQQFGFNERVFTCRHLGDGMLLKCKPDRVLRNGLVVDLKTVDGSVDPSAWSGTLAKWGYHRQAAFYLDVLQAAGQKADMFIFVAVSKDPPHHIGIYLIEDESIEQGRRENR
jgi:hypothetical protein